MTAKFTAKVGRGLGYELRKAEYQKIQDLSFSNLDNFRINSLVTRMTNDVQIVSDTFCQVLRPLLRAPLQLVFSSVFAIIMSAQLSIVFAVVVPILAILLIVVIALSRPLFVKLQGVLDKVNRTTRESITAMKLIRANAKKERETEKFSSVNQEAKKVASSALGINATNMACIQAMTYLCILGILIIGGNLAIKAASAIMIVNIASFLDYVMQMLASLIMLSNVFMIFTRADASNSRIRKVFEAENEIVEDKASDVKLENGSVELKNVFFKYKKQADEYVLSDINLDIENGQFIGITGKTGSSKSTLIYLIERFYDIEKGELKIGGKDIKEYSLNELRKNIAISFQSPQLFTGTIRDNLLWGKKDATEEEIIKACQIAQCYDFIVNTLPKGFETVMGQSGSNISGGQRQRICIARAILRNPKILILDDSFSALDRITEQQVKQNLKTMLPEMTKIVISQKVSTIFDADSIIVMDDGKVSEVGTNQQLLENNGIYKMIYSIQNEGK